MKWDRASNGGTQVFDIAHDERLRLARGGPPTGVLDAHWSPACFKKVWDWANLREDSEKDLVRVLTGDRGEACFFYLHNPGMLFSAAAKLERRKADRREASRDRKVAKWGIFIAALFVVIGGAVGALLTTLFTNSK